MSEKTKTLKKAFLCAFPHTIPIFAGFWFLGMTYGIYMNVLGFSFWYPMVMSLTIFAGSIEFVAVNMLLGAFNPLQALAMTLMINARHLFYGISMLDRFRGMGWKKIYLIFGMCDETFSINYTAEIPPDVDRGWFMFFVTLLNHFYWFFGATLGGIFGGLIHFSTEGLDFVVTAMFVVIFLEQWLKEKDHTSALAGVGISLLCLALSGRFRSRELYPSGYGRNPFGSFLPAETSGERRNALMTLSQEIITIGMVVLGTALTRYLPFLLFPAGKPTPKYIQYLGKVLPGAVFGLLVIYSLRNVSLFSGSHGIPELLAVLAVVLLHLWKRQMLLSIAGGTILYMILVQMVF